MQQVYLNADTILVHMGQVAWSNLRRQAPDRASI